MNNKNSVERVNITIVHPSDPFGLKIGGIDTFIRGFIKYAPGNFSIHYIGVTNDKNSRPFGNWLNLKLEERKISFLPVLYEPHLNRNRFAPLSLRFTFSCFFKKLQFERTILFFHRFESAFLFLNKPLKKILTVHADIVNTTSWKKSESSWRSIRWLYLKALKKVFERMDVIYAVNQDSVTYIKNVCQKKNSQIYFLPTWVDETVFKVCEAGKNKIRQELTQRYKIKGSGTWILFVGRLQGQKNPIKLLEIFKEFLTINSDSIFIAIGDGNLKTRMESYIKNKGLTQRVFLLGQLSQTEIIPFYQASDAFLLTSNFEGMPMSVLEALACGLPVVSTNVGEVGRVVKHSFSGEIVDSFDAEKICTALTKVINSPQIYTKENCVDSVKDYSPQTVLRQLYDKMEDLSKSYR